MGKAVVYPRVVDRERMPVIVAAVGDLKPNWEGSDWLVEGESLVLRDDKTKRRPENELPYIVVLELSPSWKRKALDFEPSSESYGCEAGECVG